MRPAILVVAAWTTAACASAPLRKADLAALAAADAKVLEGSYVSLLEARDTYARLATGKRRALVVSRLFEATILVALRERELAIDNRAAMEQARAIARELPPAVAAERYVDVIELIPGHDAGWSQRRRRAFERRPWRPEEIDAHVAALSTSALSPVFTRYVSLSLDCVYLTRGGPGGERKLPEVLPGAPPLLRYRVATCHGSWPDALAALKADVPHFAEAALALGRLELRNVSTDGGRKARAWLREAYGSLSKSPAVTFLNGSASQAAGDRQEALRYFDETLALEAAHEDAMLGRTVCLSHLQRHREAIDAATAILDLKTPDMGQAYYWRAWNHHKLQELAQARSDIGLARTFGTTDAVLTLAGMIEYDQDDLEPAAVDLAAAVALNPLDCTALWYRALVSLKLRAWGEGAGHFGSATTCYDALARDAERQREQMRSSTNVDEEFRALQIAGFEAAVADDRHQAGAAAYNAAVNYLRARDVVRAESYAGRAELDPEHANKVEELRQLIRERR